MSSTSSCAFDLEEETISHHLEQNPIFAKAYGHIIAIIESDKTNEEKIELITLVFMQAIENFSLEFSEMFKDLEEDSQNVEEGRIVSYDELEKQLCLLADKVDSYVKKNGILNQRNEELTQQNQRLINTIKALLREKSTFLRKQGQLIEENASLKKRLQKLSNEHKELVAQQSNHQVNQLASPHLFTNVCCGAAAVLATKYIKMQFFKEFQIFLGGKFCH